ncbi:MAG: tRNA lysidine(34) synthetase TilS [Asticcacaulis sp.]|nr:tRNA lysidine(34) synthetase TilS [Asticcacaulis sp.]
MPGLTAAFSLFDHYLDGRADHPVGVAVSGGGDSVALLYWLAEWGRRPLHVFCVDHGLNPSSSQWTQGVARHAENVGAAFTALSWTGEKPTTGLSAAARSARHALLADAARAAGVGVLCLGHTADDIAEARLMRAAGSSVGRPTLWSPSPAWPQGRGVFLFRPLLSQRREALRTWLKSKGLSWIDDPANDNTASLRARIRLYVPGDATDCRAATARNGRWTLCDPARR